MPKKRKQRPQQEQEQQTHRTPTQRTPGLLRRLWGWFVLGLRTVVVVVLCCFGRTATRQQSSNPPAEHPRLEDLSRRVDALSAALAETRATLAQRTRDVARHERMLRELLILRNSSFAVDAAAPPPPPPPPMPPPMPTKKAAVVIAVPPPDDAAVRRAKRPAKDDARGFQVSVEQLRAVKLRCTNSARLLHQHQHQQQHASPLSRKSPSAVAASAASAALLRRLRQTAVKRSPGGTPMSVTGAGHASPSAAATKPGDVPATPLRSAGKRANAAAAAASVPQSPSKLRQSPAPLFVATPLDKAMSVAFFARIPKVVEFEKLVLRALAELPDKKRVYISQSTFQRYLVDPFVAKLPERPAVCKWNQTGISLGSFVRYLQSKGYVKLSDKSASFFITEVLSTEYVPDVPAASADGIAGVAAAAEEAAAMLARHSSQALPPRPPPPVARHSPTRPVARMSVAAAAAAAAEEDDEEEEDEGFGSSAGSKSEYISAFQRIRAQLEALQKRQPLPQPQHSAPRSPQKRQTRAQTIDLCDDDQQPEKKRAKSGGIDEVGDDAITVACPFRGCPSQTIGIHRFAEHLLRCHADTPQEEFVRCPLCLYDPACDTQDDEIAHLIMHVHDAHPGFVPQSVARRLSELVGGIVQREFSDSAIAPFVLAPGPLAVSPAAGSSSVSPSASPAPAFRVDELTTDDKTGAECVICFCPFLAGERVARLECLCRFHEKCIRGWFAKSDGPRCCPNHPTTTTTTPPSP